MSRKPLIIVALVAIAIALGSYLLFRPVADMARGDVQVTQVALDGDTIPFSNVPEDVARFLEQGRNWRAARAARPLLRRDPEPELQLVSARAEAGWGGWDNALEILDDADWLDQVRSGEGWYWLGRARDETGDEDGAVEAYDRFLGFQSEGEFARVAELRRALALLQLGRREEGITALESARGRAGDAAAWIELVAAEAAAEAGDTAATRAMVAAGYRYGEIENRARMANFRAHLAAGDSTGALALAEQYRGSGSAGRRADFAVRAGRLAAALGNRDQARTDFLAGLDGNSTAAASELLEMGGLTRDQRLAVATIDARRGNNARAIEGFRFWLQNESAGGEHDRVSLQLGEALYNAGRYDDAEGVLRPLLTAGDAVAPSALLLTGRSQYRRNQRTRAFETFRELGRRYPGSPEGAEGLFLVADLSHDENEMDVAVPTYRDVATRFPRHDRAGLSLMRLGGNYYLNEDYNRAAATWDEYRTTYPSGDRWAQSTYWAGRSYDQLGQNSRADSLFQAIREREPLSYYALLSARELEQPYWPIPMTSEPTTTPEQVAIVEDLVEGLDLLREAGLYDEADSEALRLTEEAPSADGVLYALAEALNERGYAIRGIRIGQRLEQATTQMNPRLLRILYPLPYRALIQAEAEEQGLDPFLVAALTRQESLFTTRISSPVGARGLMQLMPETGQAIARGVGIDDWSEDLLFNPEINVHLGTLYLEEQMDTYDGSLPSVFSAYNAGPHRIDAWKSFPEFGDELLFTERIPYRETRDYVKILTRNMALYSGLYGETGNTGTQ